MAAARVAAAGRVTSRSAALAEVHVAGLILRRPRLAAAVQPEQALEEPAPLRAHPGDRERATRGAVYAPAGDGPAALRHPECVPVEIRLVLIVTNLVLRHAERVQKPPLLPRRRHPMRGAGLGVFVISMSVCISTVGDRRGPASRSSVTARSSMSAGTISQVRTSRLPRAVRRPGRN